MPTQRDYSCMGLKAMPKLYFIAGESSGDLLGARLMQALGDKAECAGVGGPLMTQAGINSLLPMQDIALIGFAEILPHIFRLKKRIKQTVADVLKHNPDALITIDSPGFTFRVAKALREQGYTGKLIHYVAPTVWAYKPERALKTAQLFDGLMVILPFEPPYFEAHGLDTCYVGHPIPWEWRNADKEQAPFEKKPDMFLLGMLAGSRMGEVKRHLPIYYDTLRLLAQEIGEFEVMLPVREHLYNFVAEATQHWPCKVHLLLGDAQKQAAFRACDMLLAKSGTVSVECAMAGVPTLTTYRANPISVWIIRRMVQIKFANLINITAKREIIPEYIQEDCTAEKLSQAILALKNDPEKMQQQMRETTEVLKQLSTGEDPAQKAADFVLTRLAV